MTGTPVVKDADGNDVTEQFAVSVVNGQLVINKRDVVLRSKDLTKQYDGRPLENGDEPLAIENGWAEGEGATYTFTGSQTLVGSSANAFTYTLNDNTKADNYNIDKSEGKLIVRDRDQKYAINVEANSATYTYNGKEQVAEGLKATTFTTSDGGVYTVEGLTARAAGTSAGSYTVEITGEPIVRDIDGNDVTSQFAITETPGTLFIEKAKLTITAGSASKPYDGEPLTAHFTESIEGVVDGEHVVENDLEYDGSQIEIGTSSNAVRRESVRVETTGLLEIILGGEDTTSNYDIQLNPGTLVVEQRYDLSYTVNQIYLDADGNEVKSEVIDSSNEAYYGEKILKAEPAEEVTEDNLHYVLLPNWPDYLATKDKTVGLNADENVVNIYYALDEKGNPGATDPENPTDPIPDEEDGIPDMYQIVFKYVSAGNGTVSGETYETHTFKDDNGDYIAKTSASPDAEVTVHPDEEYAFDYWTIDGSQKDFTKEMSVLKTDAYSDDTTFTVYFDTDTKGGTDPEDPDDNVPDDPDGIPDKYQTIFRYVSAGNGTVGGETYEVYTFEENGQYTEASRMPISPKADVTVSAAEGYTFDYWTIDGTRKDFSEAMTQLKTETYTQDTTFTAYFDVDGKGGTDPENPDEPDDPDGIPDKYQTIFRYQSAGNGTVNGTTYEVHTFVEDGEYTEASRMPVSPNADVTVTPAADYAFDYWTIDGSQKDFSQAMTQLKGETYVEDVTFTAYFAEDTKGGTDPADPDDNVPDDPDGIPDKYQTIFQYVSGGNGTVSGTTYEVHTFVEDGVYTEASRMPVKPNADVTVSPNTNYRFSNWTFGDQTYADTDVIAAAEFTADATFTANFVRRSTGGGGGGGGGSTSGGGASSVIRTDGTGTVTINPDDVPLAPLPDDGQSIVTEIPEEEVPLFGLPKTGDNSIPVGGLVGMMLASLLGAFGISRKRKGEDEA